VELRQRAFKARAQRGTWFRGPAFYEKTVLGGGGQGKEQKGQQEEASAGGAPAPPGRVRLGDLGTG